MHISPSLRSARMLPVLAFLGAPLGTTVGCGSDDSNAPVHIDVAFDDASERLLVVLDRDVEATETVHVRMRRGGVGMLDCVRQAAEIERVEDRRIGDAERPTYEGPRIDRAAFETPYDTSWLEQSPTPEMLAKIAEGDHIIDVCVMRDGEVLAQAELQARRALDRGGSNGKFDGEEDEVIASTEAYADRCVAELGEIPFFAPLGGGDYDTFNCLDATPIPMTVTALDGTVTYPQTEVGQCDNPQYIYDSCEPNAVDGLSNGPRVTSASNEEGTHWVLLCRKAKTDEGQYNDIAMIGHNPYTGDTCFFQNALYSRTDGVNVPHPADRVPSDSSPQTSPSLWAGIHGGLGSGIECASCHDADPFVHTPWIDGALDENGDPVVPKMGIDDDFALGFNDAPYSIVNATGQGWEMPRHLVSPEASACTSCHRIGSERWARDWMDRLDRNDSRWTSITTESHRTFEHAFWMPPEMEGVDESNWADSPFGRAMAFMRSCRANPSNCEWAPLPTDDVSGDDGLPDVTLVGSELALESLKILGADVADPSCPGGSCETRRCLECHPVSRGSLETWDTLTDRALSVCGLGQDPSTMTAEQALAAIACMRTDPSDPTSPFATANIGILSTGVQYNHFRNLFRTAYGDEWLIPYNQFKARVSMPKGNHEKLSLYEYAVLLKWFDQDLVALDDVLQDAPPPQTCVDSLDTAALAAHIDEMQFEGWGAVNDDNGIRMFGCPTDGDPRQCFASGGFTDRTMQWGTSDSTVRQLAALDFTTSFWTRSSADGRYVGNGGGPTGATITDLQTGRNIGVQAYYDPGFFPDNSGFIYQGGGTGLCSQRVLDSGDSFIDFSEPGCMRASGVNLYQHVARGLNGGDYFVINSQFTSDPGNGDTDPSAFFSASSTMKFTPMVFNGTTYEQHDAIIVDSPYEGDSVLSPSSRIVVSRLAGPTSDSLGYVLREVRATRTGTSYVMDISRELGTVCMPGAKANISFDERFMVTHHYEGGTANLYLVDMLNGQRHRITDMPNDHRALFPHFVSNGWIYFLVQGDDGRRYVAASDAALRLLAE